MANQVGLSEFHFQRLFTRRAGISPKRFLQFLIKETAKALLTPTSVLSASYETGLASPSRLHDLFVHSEAVTPTEYKSHSAGLEIAYGFHLTTFGECLLAITLRGICFPGFIDHDRLSAFEQLSLRWANASLSESDSQTAPWLDMLFSPQHDSTLTIHLKGTNFQLKIWEALLRLSPGEVTTYQGLATQIDKVSAVRAAGNAVGHNPVAYLLPCHRVLHQSGEFGQYRPRKKAILFYEAGLSE